MAKKGEREGRGERGYFNNEVLEQGCQVKKSQKKVEYEDVIQQLIRLGFGNGKECIPLLEGHWEDKTLDLSLISEVKRGANGAIEIKLIDRVSILYRLLELMKTGEDGAEAFLRSLQEEHTWEH